MNREQLLRNETYWIETIQNRIYHELVSHIRANDLSQKEMAKRLGVSKGRISQILSGNYLNFKIDSIVKIALATDNIPNIKFENIDNYVHRDKEELLSSQSLNTERKNGSQDDGVLNYPENETAEVKTIPINDSIHCEVSLTKYSQSFDEAI